MDFDHFFSTATGHKIFPYQKRLGSEPWPELVDIPTGLGKTAAVTVAWLYKRLNSDPETPKRLIYCLPMRVLVEQTYENVASWLERSAHLFGDLNMPVPKVYSLMGGDNDPAWAEHPEDAAIIIGTQDMLLSRALMRGYGMSRYQWPVHFAVLHNDAIWVFDEIQLMGAGLPTSAQLEALRRRYAVACPCKSVWMSATLNARWLNTVDMAPHLENSRTLTLSVDERACAPVLARRGAVKRLQKATTCLTAENQKQSAKLYTETLAIEVLEQHVKGTCTIVVLNTVERAQGLLAAIDRLKPDVETLLVHSRFRPQERKLLNDKLSKGSSVNGSGCIVVTTQALEAGVDITSRVLFTELAPWSSLVQRFGRNNRYGEANGCGGSDVFWIDFEEDAKLEMPYQQPSLAAARAKLGNLVSASSADLPEIDEKAEPYPLLRAKDFRDLFNTDPDLSGFDVDVSIYIRDADDLDVQLFWRDLAQGPESQMLPERDELCRASLGQMKSLLDRIHKMHLSAYRWDSLDGRWKGFTGKIRPGLVLMLDLKSGGYSDKFGLLPSCSSAVLPVAGPLAGAATETFNDDWRSRCSRSVELCSHLMNATARAVQLCRDLGVTEGASAIQTSVRWHDVGKSHPVFQATMHECPLDEVRGKFPLLAKSASKRTHQRRYFRHELASMLAWLEHGGGGADSNLVAYLIAAHHGKVRLSLRAMPNEKEPAKPFGPRFARGVWEGEELPEVVIGDGLTVPSTRLRLDLMELGEGAMGASWTARTQKLLDDYGPFRLAWFEALVRIVDWRVSGAEQEGN